SPRRRCRSGAGRPQASPPRSRRRGSRREPSPRSSGFKIRRGRGGRGVKYFTPSAAGGRARSPRRAGCPPGGGGVGQASVARREKTEPRGGGGPARRLGWG